MDTESLMLSLELAAGSGQGLSPDRRAALLTSLLLVKRDYRYNRVLFWGRILGIVADYYIAQGLAEDQLAPRKTLYSLNCMEWSLLPPATEEMAAQVATVKGRFMGDPSHEYEQTEFQKMSSEGEKPFEEDVVVQVKEETRLVSVIDQIDKAVAIIPRGAFFKTPYGPVHVNRTFEGLPLSEAKKLSSYFHFREPVSLKNKTLLEKADLDPSLDFLDSLEYDIPKGVAKWPCHRDAYSARREVRALSSSSLAASVRGRRVLAKITVSSWLSHCILGLHCSRGLDDFGATPGSKGPGASSWSGATRWWCCAACCGRA
ncbi:radial spoke head protein 9 homolog isoform X1 [Cavia porcellus]|uniref:radial spoke head protein 9 homolog isoform X1 n=1 Tax=Cavia porcellus TaxID=10141 RepID=UPI000C8796F8|nr:radial spoke head protein 9 homolog isoform X1 [Cavia porcellus]